MSKIKLTQWIAIALASAAFIWMSLKGFKTSQGTSEQPQDEISQAIETEDVESLLNMIGSGLDTDTSASAISKRISAYEILLKKENLTEAQKVEYARLRISNAGTDEDVMRGVSTLLSVIRADSNNVAALELLGEMSVQSGQMDKAKERYEKLLILQPQNERYKQMLEMIKADMVKSPETKGARAAQ